MKERPILFSGPMVRAILEGRKTQTRWVIKPQPRWEGLTHKWLWWQGTKALLSWRDDTIHPELVLGCPYGVPGDRLWVRETWAALGTVGQRQIGIAYRADGELKPDVVLWPQTVPIYKWPTALELLDRRWRPSIHMPRWASRLTLEVTGVRVEQVQDISLEHAIAEGCPEKDFHNMILPILDGRGGLVRQGYVGPVAWFHDLWDDLNAKRGYGWEANPWVWVVDFVRIDGD